MKRGYIVHKNGLSVPYCRILPLFVAILLFYGCNKDPKGLSIESDNFEELSREGLVYNKNYLYSFNDVNSQRIVNRMRRTLLLQLDNQAAYVNVKFVKPFNGLPVKGEEMYVLVKYKTSGAISENEVSMTMLVLKTEEEKVWLWCEERKMGLILRL